MFQSPSSLQLYRPYYADSGGSTGAALYGQIIVVSLHPTAAAPLLGCRHHRGSQPEAPGTADCLRAPGIDPDITAPPKPASHASLQPAATGTILGTTPPGAFRSVPADFFPPREVVLVIGTTPRGPCGAPWGGRTTPMHPIRLSPGKFGKLVSRSASGLTGASIHQHCLWELPERGVFYHADLPALPPV
ncbi:hypothetical protein GWK47_011831 [Chionoecetes opilio]|uniref:Uncharacterized protein n=1 Tax=Chionoecetes opilio TaxID=41210 RepID=A0A8J5CMB3_CHIOP|nr:hypothetical protein GWK47_011831 [Chionoecetes opilio]